MKRPIPTYNWQNDWLQHQYDQKQPAVITYFDMEYDALRKGHMVTFFDRYGRALFRIFFDGDRDQERYVYWQSMHIINRIIRHML